MIKLISWFSFPSSLFRGRRVACPVHLCSHGTSGEGFATQKHLFRASLGFSAGMRLPRQKPMHQNQSNWRCILATPITNKKRPANQNQKRANQAVPRAVCGVGVPGFPVIVAVEDVPLFTAWLSPKVLFPALESKGVLGATF